MSKLGILKTIVFIIGYVSGFVGCLLCLYFLICIFLYGSITLIEPNMFILWLEIILYSFGLIALTILIITVKGNAI